MVKRAVAVVLCLLCLVVAPLRAQLPRPEWVNVMDFGAKGDRVTDDTAAIFSAINYGVQHGINVVYFPPGHSFVIASAQTLPQTQGLWMTLFLDSTLLLGGTLTVPGAYVLHGNSSGQLEAFSMDTLSILGIASGTQPNPMISIASTGVRLENLQIFVPEGSDGIVLQHAARVYLKNVWAEGHGGIPLRINAGFGFEIEGGGFSNTEAVPSVEFSDDHHCDLNGILRMRGTFLAGRGIHVMATCGGVNSMTFDNILYEEAQNAFLNVESHSNVAIFGISIRDLIMADSQARPLPPIIDVKCPRQLGCGGGVNGVTIQNYSVDGDVITTGDTIRDLEVWDSYGVGSIAQTTEYVHHTPFGIIDTMPTDRSLSGQKDFALTPYSQSTVTVKAGSDATYQIEIIPTGGFDQNVTLNCSGLPPGASCQVAPNPAAPFSLPVLTIVSTARSFEPAVRWMQPRMPNYLLSALVLNILGLAVLGTFLALRLNARPRWIHVYALLLMGVVMLSSSCSAVVASGGHDGNSAPAPSGSTPAPVTQTAPSGTPAGTYPFTISGTATVGTATVTHTTQLTVVIQ